jgi:succinate-semialdehyde dehydrogenase/glutarate-semialdehyde dehydrogenase
MTAPERAGLPAVSLKDPKLFREQCYVDGAWCGAASGRTFAVTNPATGATIARVPDMGAQDARRAIEAAHAAWAGWRAKTAKERAAVMRRWFDLVMANQEDLALLLTSEQGKPLAEARGEIAYGASFIEWYAEEGKRVYGDVIPQHQADKRLLVLKQPVGVTAAITPWNFPNAMITRKVAPALAAGCTVVLKPAEQTPLSALALAELAERAGMPKGVLNILTTNDPPAVGAELTSNPLVRKITFTGSTEVGRILMRQSADQVKKISFELGGNAPLIVFDDADLDAAVDGAIASKFRNAGQTCVCANRIFVQDAIYDAFAARFTEKVAAFKVGPGTEPGVVIGPLIDAQGLAKVVQHVQDAVAKGAKALTGGRKHALGGLFFEPTVLTGASEAMTLAREETFGPVAPLFRFRTEEDAVRMANATEFGLAAYFFARDLGRVFRVAEALEAGIVAVNTGIFSQEVAPFGGVKQSGIGREGSKYGIEPFLEIKFVCLGGI